MCQNHPLIRLFHIYVLGSGKLVLCRVQPQAFQTWMYPCLVRTYSRLYFVQMFLPTSGERESYILHVCTVMYAIQCNAMLLCYARNVIRLTVIWCNASLCAIKFMQCDVNVHADLHVHVHAIYVCIILSCYVFWWFLCISIYHIHRLCKSQITLPCSFFCLSILSRTEQNP